jgi:hypothetical protein
MIPATNSIPNPIEDEGDVEAPSDGIHDDEGATPVSAVLRLDLLIHVILSSNYYNQLFYFLRFLSVRRPNGRRRRLFLKRN